MWLGRWLPALSSLFPLGKALHDLLEGMCDLGIEDEPRHEKGRVEEGFVPRHVLGSVLLL